MTAPQRATLENLLEHHASLVTETQQSIEYAPGVMDPHVGRHGGCVGGDEQFHHLCKKFGWRVEVLPGPTIEGKICYADADYIYPPAPHMQRNKSLVAFAHWMYAAPYEREPQEHGGTWKTIGFARKAKRPLTIVYHDGNFTTENTP